MPQLTGAQASTHAAMHTAASLQQAQHPRKQRPQAGRQHSPTPFLTYTTGHGCQQLLRQQVRQQPGALAGGGLRLRPDRGGGCVPECVVVPCQLQACLCCLLPLVLIQEVCEGLLHCSAALPAAGLEAGGGKALLQGARLPVRLAGGWQQLQGWYAA